MGKRALMYGANYLLGSILPMRIVKCVVAAAPYTPAAVVLATGGTGALVANTTYIVISQLSEYVFVCAVRRATWAGAKATLRVAKYVFITRPLGLDSGTAVALDEATGELLDVAGLTGGKEGMDEGWVLVDEEGDEEVEQDPKLSRGAINQLMHQLKAQEKGSPGTVEITEEMVEISLLNVYKIAKELKPEEGDAGVEFVDGDGVVFEEAWDKSVVLDKTDKPGTSSPHSEDQEFVMV